MIISNNNDPQSNVIEDNDLKKSVNERNSVPKFDFQSAQPLKTIPQLSTNRSARYQRPITDEERGQATADYFTGKPSVMTQENRAINSPEISTGISTLLGGGSEAFGNFVPNSLGAIRGILANKEHPEKTGDPFKDMMNSLHDNAMRGIFEPETTEPTSVHIINNPEIFGKTNYQTAAVFGTLAEFTATMITNPPGAIMESIQGLSKDVQNYLLFNKITQSTHWGDNITSMAAKSGTTWQKILPQAQRELHQAIVKSNYLQVVMKNIELYKPFKLQGLTTEDVKGGFPKEVSLEPIEGFPNNKKIISEGKEVGDLSHSPEEGFNINIKEGLQSMGYGPAAINQFFQSGQTHITGDVGKNNIRGQNFWIGIGGKLTETTDGNLKLSLSKEDFYKKNKEKQLNFFQSQPYEIQNPIVPQRLINMRQNYLEERSSNIDAQMRDLESQQKRLRDNGLSTGRIDAKLDKLGKDWLSNESHIAENMIGQIKINELKSQIGQTKIENIIKDVQDAEEKGISAGMRKGLTLGKEKGRIEEVNRKAALQTFAKYKKNAVDEMNKIASNLQRIKDNTEGLPLEYKNKLDEILNNFDLAKRTNKTLTNRQGLLDFIAKAKASGDDINIPDTVIKIASQTPLNEITVNELRDLNNMVGNIYRMGKLKNKLIEAKGLRDLDVIVKQSVSNITGGKGISIDSNLVKLMKERDKNIIKLLSQGKWNDFREFIISNILPELQINFLDGVDHTGIATRTLFDPMHEASNKFLENQDKAFKTIGDMFNHRDPKGWQEIVKIGNLNIKRSEMMFVYANAANDANRSDLFQYGLSEEDISNIEKALTDEDKMAVRKLWNYFDKEQFPRLFNERYSLEGVSTKKEDNYFPITNLDNVSSSDDLDWERMYRDSLRTKAGVDKGMLKERTKASVAFRKMDFFGTIGRSIDRAEHYLAYARHIRNANKFLNHPDIKSAIINNKNFGEHYYNTLTKWVKDAARGKLDYDTGWPARISRKGRLSLAPGVLGLNFVTAEKQFIGFLNGIEMAGKSATLKILPNLIMKYIKNSKEISTESPMMNYRGMRQEREFEEMRSERGFFEKIGKLRFLHNFQQKMMFFTQQADLLISRAVYMGTKQALKDSGVTDKQQLIREAERTVRRTQPMGGLIYLPDIFRGGELEKQFTFLKGHRNKFFNLQLELLAKKTNGSISNARFTSGVLFQTLFPVIVLSAIEHKKLSDAADWVEATSSQLFSGVALIQDLFDSLREGKWTFSEPFIEISGMFGKIFSSKKISTKLKRTAEAIGTTAGLPVVGVERILKGEPFGSNRTKKYDKDFNQSKNTVDLMK